MIDIIQCRLNNQQLSNKKFGKPEEIVEWLGAVQAQDYSGGLWGIGLRLPKVTIDGIEKAISDRKIIRTWPMRGTLHFVPARDAAWMLELMTPRIIKKNLIYYKKLDLNEKIFNNSKDIFINELQKEKILTRIEMYQALENNGVNISGQRGYHILVYLAQKGVICFGVKQKKQHTFVLLDSWVPDSRRLNREEALAEITKRYFTSRGPATLQDFMWWSGIAALDAAEGVELNKSEILAEKINGQIYYMTEEISNHKHIEAHLLAPYDEYFIAYKDRSAAIDSKMLEKINLALTNSPLIINGLAAGIWKHEIKEDSVVITTNLFRPIKEDEMKALNEAGDQYGNFLGKSVILS